MTRPAPANKVVALQQTIAGFQRRNERLVAENKRLRRVIADLRREAQESRS